VPRRVIPVLVACGLCALAALAAVALAAPARRSERNRHPHARVCRRHAHRRRCHARHAPAAHRPVAPSASVPGSNAQGAGRSGASGPAGGSTAPAPTGFAPAAPGEGGVSAGQAPARTQVTAVEFKFTLSRSEAPAGKVILELLDNGQDEHDLHIRPAAGGPDVAAHVAAKAGEHKDEEIELAPGTYTFYCSLPGHEAKGMKATFTVR
jgi:plastocyanin